MTGHNPSLDYQQLAADIKAWGQELGFQKIAISDARTGEHEGHLERWLASGFHGEMEYMARHGTKRSRPPELQPGTQRVISARMDYLAADTQMVEVLQDKSKAYISRYTLGRGISRLKKTRSRRIDPAIGCVCRSSPGRPAPPGLFPVPARCPQRLESRRGRFFLALVFPGW